MTLTSRKQQLLALFVGLAVVLAVLPGAVSAQSGAGGTVTVESGETVSGLSGAYGTIIVEGTVTGDVSGAAGSVVIRDGGVVEGDLEAASGNLRIAGTVNGGVSTGAGSIYLTETGVVDGDFEVGAGDVRIEGTINGDAKIGAETIRLGEAATIAGSLTYDGDLQGNRDAVQGDITRDRSLGPSIFTDLQPFASWVFSLYALLANFLLGALLLGLFPQFSDRVADRVATDPLRSGLAGAGTMLGVPVLLVLVAITVIGIPLSVAGLLAFMLFVWIGLVYGRFAVGVWLLSLADVDNRWGALVAGLLVAAVLGQIPVVGGLANFVIVLLGLGALVVELVSRRQRITGTSKEQTDSAPVD